MKSLWRKIKNGLESVSTFLVALGPFGLFAIAFLDSALVPLPGGADAVMIALSIARPSWVVIYALAATLGSTLGCIVLYKISQRAGRRALESFSEKKRARVKELVDKYDMLTVLVASFLPPPFPLKLFIITAGVFRLNLFRFTLGVAIGRAVRFLLEGYLAVVYGDRAKDVLAENYPAIGLGLAGLAVLIFLLRAALKKRREGVRDAEQRIGES